MESAIFLPQAGHWRTCASARIVRDNPAFIRRFCPWFIVASTDTSRCETGDSTIRARVSALRLCGGDVSAPRAVHAHRRSDRPAGRQVLEGHEDRLRRSAHRPGGSGVREIAADRVPCGKDEVRMCQRRAWLPAMTVPSGLSVSGTFALVSRRRSSCNRRAFASPTTGPRLRLAQPEQEGWSDVPPCFSVSLACPSTPPSLTC